MALGRLPSEAELNALVERYAGSRRVSCEQADLFFASVGEVTPLGRAASNRPGRKLSAAPRDAAEVARSSWLNKLGSRSSAPPRSAAASARAPALSMSAVAVVPQQEEPITIEQALEHLPATTYSSAPPPSALPTEDSAPVALPLSSHPAPPLAAADSMVLERWGMAETTPEVLPDIEVEEPEHPTDESAAEEDALLNQWSDDLDQALGLSARPAAESARPATLPAGALEAEQAASTDAPERWSAPHLAGEAQVSTPVVHDDDAPLSAAELSLLDQWSSEDPAEPAAAVSEDTRRSSRPPGRTLPAPPRSMRPPLPARPVAALATQTAQHDEPQLDVELEEEIELEPDDLIEID